ncbi:ras GTPase-activating protein-binding protein 2-like isoform X2 [Cynara cardunculus var. scolymus]|uniref:ras GTPase-activating protein-binding protein 2-like isoform X2 n=1 Tax=Cynara cardunculus var. scolymus TaxID=59895 RepID=UPI000D62B61A|nr:ras GTPase-activating protein-binding protein 2-like isoform X2 [Cynara cardunculus var. scolymus]
MEKGNVMEAPSLSAQDEADAFVKHDYSAQDVADAFVKQYYNILQTSPKDAHKFYKDESILAHPCADGSMKSLTTLKDIDHELMSSNIKDWNPNLSTVHFTHSFFLAPQNGGGFFVRNDFLQFIEINKISETSLPLDDAANHLIAPQSNDTAKDSSLETAEAPEKDLTKKSTSKKEDGDSSKGKKSLPAEPNKKSEPLTPQPAPNMQDDAKRVSYASIVAKEGSVASIPPASPNAVVRALPNTDRQSSMHLAIPKPSALPAKASTLPSNVATENIYDFKSIRIKDLPPKITHDSLLEVVKKFGPVKHKNIQIKEYSEDGYRYAFVEFDNTKSARSAIEARYIKFEDRESEIQYKRSSNQGGYNNMGRSPSGKGGFRNDNFWPRDGEGRGSGSWGRYNEHENGGDPSGQARDYNQRRTRFVQDQARSFT